MKLYWTTYAKFQISELFDYIAADNPRAAGWQVRRITEVPLQLTTFPHLGQTGRVSGSRELAIAETSYVLVYRIHQQSIMILAVQHGLQQWPSSFPAEE